MLEKLSAETIEDIFTQWPIETSFVDADDTVQYYRHADKRILRRTPALMGMKVQDCHLSRSVDFVQQILDDFKSGRRDVVEFRANHSGRLTCIRYFAVRDGEDNYQGVIEVTRISPESKNTKEEGRLPV
jgi:DUF438 domain-containing protein